MTTSLRGPKFWTPEKVARLTALCEQQIYSATEIADDLGCTRNMAIGKVSRMPNLSLLPLRVVSRRPKQFVPKAKPKPIIAEPAPEAPPSLMLDIEVINDTTCRYPGPETRAPYSYCGNAVHKGAYCSYHFSLCCVPGTSSPSKQWKEAERDSGIKRAFGG